MAAKRESHVCKGGSTLLFACSGGADVGHVADLAARRMAEDGAGAMFCLAGVGGGVEPIVKKTGEAATIVAIDGCSLDCAKKTLEGAGFGDFVHFRVTDAGYKKGSSPPSKETIAEIAALAAKVLEERETRDRP